jgi:fructose-1,6-bisphosphatase/inositol monophosphatase family enzyme
VQALKDFQAAVRERVVQSHGKVGGSRVARSSSSDTIYQIDTEVDPLLEAFCREWSASTPLVLIAEGIEGDDGREGMRVFPEGSREEEALIRLLVDPIDGTRGLMYDKRSAWALAGVAPNKGPQTRLRDIEVAVMSELPTSKSGQADVLWAIKGRGAHGQRVDLRTGIGGPLMLQPSTAPSINHGFASVSNFFPGTKVLASELMEFLAAHLTGAVNDTRAVIFDDQYISTGGQFYELIVGHDRFVADLRPTFYGIQGRSEGMCCHPYDCATWLIADEAGVILTDADNAPLDGPMDVTSGISWLGYANSELHRMIAPLIRQFLVERKRR